MNVYEKLQKVRCELQQCNIKKGGKNNFSHYTYYELSDLLPVINDLCMKNKLTPIVRYTAQQATLTVVNSENPEEFIEFISPFIVSELKGSTKIQALGSSHTYLRRYLYLTAFEIVESDYFEQLSEEDKVEVDLNKDKKDELIEKIKKNVKKNENVANALKDLIKKRKVTSVSELSFNDLQEVVDLI